MTRPVKCDSLRERCDGCGRRNGLTMCCNAAWCSTCSPAHAASHERQLHARDLWANREEVARDLFADVHGYNDD